MILLGVCALTCMLLLSTALAHGVSARDADFVQGFLSHAFATDTALMAGGLILMGHQFTGSSSNE